MKSDKNKQNLPSLQAFFVKLWLTTILVFIFTINTSNNSKSFTSFLAILFLANILIGIIAFIAIFSKKIFINCGQAKFTIYTSLMLITYFFFYVTTMTINGDGFIASQMNKTTTSEVVESVILPTSNESPTSTSTPLPIFTPTPILQQRPVKPITTPRASKISPDLLFSGTTIGESELISAINIYRQARGLSTLNTNESLCQETRKRVQDMIQLNVGKKIGDPLIMNHDGMVADSQNGVLGRLLPEKTYFGENIASAFCKRLSDGQTVYITTGIQLVEWCFDSSETHKENLIRPDWTDVCSSGQFPFYVQTFAK